jgi:oxygen-independent coproporphyrinogen-3 oxidase
MARSEEPLVQDGGAATSSALQDRDDLPALGPGIYVHVPFCASRCDYCAFSTWTDRHHLRSAYVGACLEEYERARQSGLEQASTIFLGGGTPSQLPPDELVRLVSAIDRTADAEVTVEANPEDVTGPWLSACVEAGVNRISLGVQSLDPSVLVGLGRRHDPEAVAVAVANVAAAGIGRCSVDLIYGGCGETDESWRATLAGVLALEPRPAHVSAYALTVEPGTPLAKDASRHPDDDEQANRYEILDAVLSEAGYRWYEISNWCQSGEESRHNLNYWAQGDYRGIGCAAHSHSAGRRWWNVRTPERYIEMIRSGLSPESVSETLTQSQGRLESLELALRTRYGVPVQALGSALDSEPALKALVTVDDTTGRAVLTLTGRLLANEVACRLRPEGEKPPDTWKGRNSSKVVEITPEAIGMDSGTVVSLQWPSRLPG